MTIGNGSKHLSRMTSDLIRIVIDKVATRHGEPVLPCDNPFRHTFAPEPNHPKFSSCTIRSVKRRARRSRVRSKSAAARCTKSVWIHSNKAVSIVNPWWTVVLDPWGSVLVISILVCCTKDNGRTAVVPPLYIIHDPRVCSWPRRRL